MDIATLSSEEVVACLAGPPSTRASFLGKAAAAGHAEAQALLGQMLLDGNGITADAHAALGWFARAAAQHHLMALNMVGRCYDLGWGTPVDKRRAAECFRVAAARGLPWAMYNYATALALGDGVAENKAAALAWLEQAAAADDDLARAKAVNFIGSFAEDGWAGPVDLHKAADCYRRAAEGGDFRGCFNHARLLIDANRPHDAMPWIEQALTLGTPRFRTQVRDWMARAEEPIRSQGLALC